MADIRVEWHWRDTMRPVRFFKFDVRAVFPVFFLVVYPRAITLFIAVVSMIVFSIVERFGLSFPSALRKLRVVIIGNYRPPFISLRRRRKMVDYG